MKTFTIKLIIPFLFIFLHIINSSSAYSCDTVSCPRSLNSSDYTTEVSVQSPFRLKPMQAKSCGYEGFDLHCDDTLGTLIQFPNNVVLHVDEINYYSNVLILSDPYDHSLMQKLLSFDLDDTPFHPAKESTLFYSQTFWLYKCSIFDSYSYNLFDRIDCLNVSGYIVISEKLDTTGIPILTSCTFLKMLTVATLSSGSSPYYGSGSRLCTISQIALSWSEQEVPSARKYYSSPPVSLIVPLLGFLIPFTIMLCCLFRCWCRRNAQATTTSTMNNQSRVIGPTSTVTGLDQVTIDSYPVVVVGASGRIIKPDDTTCPICLSDYCPQETLKILPECIHRFHADCIDQWLRSKGVCPICRTSTPHTTSSNR